MFLADTPYSGGGSAQFLEVRHRGHVTVEDHIRCGKTTGFGRFPSRHFAINLAWLELGLAAIFLLAWMRVLLWDGELAAAEPKNLRYRLLQVAARLARGQRLRFRISQPLCGVGVWLRVVSEGSRGECAGVATLRVRARDTSRISPLTGCALPCQPLGAGGQRGRSGRS